MLGRSKAEDVAGRGLRRAGPGAEKGDGRPGRGAESGRLSVASALPPYAKSCEVVGEGCGRVLLLAVSVACSCPMGCGADGCRVTGPGVRALLLAAPAACPCPMGCRAVRWLGAKPSCVPYLRFALVRRVAERAGCCGCRNSASIFRDASGRRIEQSKSSCAALRTGGYKCLSCGREGLQLQ